MNRQSGRRRGRGGNNRPQNNSGGRGSDPQNRIDNRTRGNAAQLLEKYKGLARDAQMAGDRVNTEYYLQFADHYFRVLADAQARREEQQAQQGGERQQRWRDQNGGDDFIEGVDDMDFGVESDVVEARRGQRSRAESDQDEGGDERSDNSRERQGRSNDRENGRENNRRQQRNGPGGSYRAYRENQDRAANDSDGNRVPSEAAEDGGFDQSILPPAISASDDETSKAKPKARTTRTRKAAPAADKGDDIAAE